MTLPFLGSILRLSPILAFKVVVNKNSLSIKEKCLVPFKLGCYSKEIYCDVLPMNVAHILLDGILIQDGNLVDYFGKKIQ